ncbi:(deoxy)nucleoside triphosphate pyrophosphohydrolase [Pontibacter mangrovi]|uniref:8-oxo-dGTP diphosphatase n=1 Tax=Pontibacter mangrovi TaxID=2589816 RepID=A0A501WCR6_9BACT|nr:(deoxy)nucleoside triphosphate pyrophosphohydrolase [Pontibacter mangrovi]TPE45874.1 (deoxy)nucleoside triphosphate pyrophosphohydrolase [Pontibacter mangrovi]
MITVVCALIEHNNRVLIAQRGEKMQQALLWEFPGGKLERGEAETDGLVREIQEELAITVQPYQRLSAVNHNNALQLVPYLCHFRGGIVQLLEHRAYYWVVPEELPKYTWCPADVPVVEEYLQLTKCRD